MTMPHLMNCSHAGDGWCLDCVKAEWERREAAEARLHEALWWAVGFIRCNFPKAREQYENMRNAEDLAEKRPLMWGEFHLTSARAELAEVARDKLLNFAKNVATNYDHEEYTREHREGYGGICRECSATEVIRDVLGDDAEAFLKGPYRKIG